MQSLYSLIYTSVRSASCTEKEIEKILDSCKKNNPGKHITGVLLYSNKRFIQYIEGNEKEITALYELILSDKRHSGIMKRAFLPIQERLFPSWHMGYKDIDRQAPKYLSAISAADHKAFNEMLSGDTVYDNRSLRILKLFFEMS